MTAADNKQQLIEAIDAILPQTQCEQCGYAGCKPYATAIAIDNEAINKCPPGNTATIAALSKLLHKPVIPLAEPEKVIEHKLVAKINEDSCIGCKLCIKACPVDAIIGAGKLMHSVISNECTGCELCIAPCPMDCIDMVPDTTQKQSWSIGDDAAMARANVARERTVNRQQRLAAQQQKQQQQHDSALGAEAKATSSTNKRLIKTELMQALQRAQEKKYIVYDK